MGNIYSSKKNILLKTLLSFSEKISKAYNICLQIKLSFDVLVYERIYRCIYLWMYLSTNTSVNRHICLQTHQFMDI